MSTAGLDKLLKTISTSRLLSDGQLKTLREQLTGNELKPETLAQILVRQKHLTEWQARQLLKGQSGFVLNQYHLQNPIGRGGMGHVFRALDVISNRVVAVKVMARKLTENQTLVSRFQREIRASSELDSAHIVRTLDAGRVGKVDFMVMEYVNGDQVDEIASELGRLPVGLACGIIRDVAEGLQHAHEHRMVHRDIKPSNMMIHWEESGRGTTKLMDMGLVLVMSETGEDHTVTRAGQVMGTPDYMSPEQGWDTTKVDIRSDIYSLGCTLFRLLSGRIPFTGSNPLQVLSQRLQRDAPSIQSVCPEIPDEVAEVVTRMTRRDPLERYQTPAEAAEALAAFSEPITKGAFKSAPRHEIDSQESEPAGSKYNEVDEADVTYKQFLTEVENGSVVDLMLSTDAATDVSAATRPVIELNIAPDEYTAQGRGRSKTARVQRGRRNSIIMMGLATALLVIVILAAAFSVGDTDSDDDGQGSEASQTEAAAGTFAEQEALQAQSGEQLVYEPKAEFTADSGTVKVEIGEYAPVGVRISEEGKLLWDVPSDQTSGDYTVPLVLVHTIEEEREVLDEVEIHVNVKPGLSAVRFPPSVRHIANIGEKLQIDGAVEQKFRSLFDLRYSLGSGAPQNVSIDSKTGQLTFQPTLGDIGQRQFFVSVSGADDSKPVAQTEVLVFVQPSLTEHVLLSVPPVVAKRGEKVQVPLRMPPALQQFERQWRRNIRFASPPPAGMVISPTATMLVWDVPADASDRVTVSLEAAMMAGPALNNRIRRMKGEVEIEFRIEGPAPPSLPTEEEIAPLLEQLKETHRSKLIAARRTDDRVDLSWELLDVVREGQADTSSAAMLQLIEEDLATRSRAVEVLFEVDRLRSQWFQTDELAAAAESIKLFRKTGMSSDREDQLMEHVIRLCLKAIPAEKFDLVHPLIEAAAEVYRSRNGSDYETGVAKDLETAQKLAESLASDDGGNREIDSQELTKLLKSRQFEPLFSGNEGVSFFGLSSPGTDEVSATDLWSIAETEVRLKTDKPLQAIVGFMGEIQHDRYAIRADIYPQTTSAYLVLGAESVGLNDFKGSGVIMDNTGPGTIVDLRQRQTLAEPKVKVSMRADRINRVEVVSDSRGTQVKINGVIVTQTQSGPVGRLGVAASLGTTKPALLIRNLRIVRLPSDE